MNCAELRASRTDAVATAKILSAPRASAIERNRLMQSVARSIAAVDSCSIRSVSWPRRTVSFSRASTANESLAAASTTTSLIEFDPTSIAAIFMAKIYELFLRSSFEPSLILTQRAPRSSQRREEETSLRDFANSLAPFALKILSITTQPCVWTYPVCRRARAARRRFAFDHARDQTLKIIFDSLDGSRRIYYLKSVLAAHPIKLLEQQFLISDEAVVIIISQTQIHSRFPVIKTAARRQHACRQFFHRSEAQIKDRVRYQPA